MFRKKWYISPRNLKNIEKCQKNILCDKEINNIIKDGLFEINLKHNIRGKYLCMK